MTKHSGIDAKAESELVQGLLVDGGELMQAVGSRWAEPPFGLVASGDLRRGRESGPCGPNGCGASARDCRGVPSGQGQGAACKRPPG